MKKFVLFIGLFFYYSLTTFSQVIWSNEINGISPSLTNPYYEGSVKADGVTVSGIQRGPGLIARNVADAFSAISWPMSPNKSTSDYFSFEITPSSCSSINFTEFFFNASVASQGPTLFELNWSIGNSSGTLPVSGSGGVIDLSDPQFQNITVPITFKLYGWQALSAGTAGTFSILDFSFNGTVIPAPINLNSQPSSTSNTVCVGQSLPPLSVGSTGEGTPSYQWYQNTTGNNNQGTLIPGAEQSTLNIPTNVQSSAYYFCKISYGQCNINSEVSGLNTVSSSPIISVQPSSGSTLYLCEDDLYVLTVGAAGEDLTYQWFSNDLPNNTSGTLINGANEASFQVPTNVSSSKYYYCQLSSPCGTIKSSVSRRIRVTTINSEPSPLSQSTCVNGTLNPLSVTLAGTGVTYSYSWYYNTIEDNNSGTLVDNATGSSYTPSNAVAQNGYYYAVVGVSVSGVLQCSITSELSGLITVSSGSQGGYINGGGAVLCSGVNDGQLTLEGNVGEVINWQFSTNNGLSWSTIANQSNVLTYNNISVNTSYRAIVQSGLCPSANSSSAFLTVNTTPNFSMLPEDTAICNAGVIDLLASNNVNNTYTGIAYAFNFNSVEEQNDWSITSSGSLSWSYQESPYILAGNTYNSNDGNFVFVSSEGLSGTSSFISPVIDLSDLTNVSLSYRTFYSDVATSDFARVYYSGNGGNSWVAATPLSSSVGARTNFSTQTLTVPSIYLTNNFRVRFEYTGNNNRYWAIDNVNILGAATGFTFSWSPSDGLSNVNGASTVASVANDISYECVVANKFGCVDTLTSVITVDEAGPSINIELDDPIICQGNFVNFISIVQNEGANPVYQWRINNIDVLGSNSSMFSTNSLLDGDVVSCLLISENACVGSSVLASNTIMAEVNEKPNLSLLGDLIGCGQVDLELVGAENALWSGGESIGTLTNSILLSGDYSVKGTNAVGCEDSLEFTVEVQLVEEYFADLDGDFFGDFGSSILSCEQPIGFVTNNLDCNDGEVTINPSNAEICNGVDDNCNLVIDEGFILNFYYLDLDADNFGDLLERIEACVAPNSYVLDSTDCDDASPFINPLAIESCNLLDDNCDEQIDEGFSNQLSYADDDGDSFGNINIVNNSCSVPSGFVLNDLDCDDLDLFVNPLASEICNTIDDNCDEVVDEGFDLDSDGVLSCDGDCDDSNPFVNTNLVETCDGIDNNCDEVVDEGFDLDFDGVTICAGDCDDNDDQIFSGSLEICGNAIDENCDGIDDVCEILGCTDPTAFNYDATANTDDGSCVPVINGCTDPTAFNYDATANTDDGSCVPVINGCTDPTAFNYDATANTDDGSCVPVINGCTDPTAFNYDATANTDDGSCVPVINGCTDPTAFNYDATANTDDGSCVPVINGCTDPTAFNYDATANTDDGSCVPVINGCTDATAFNYNPAANTDDGSCVPVINGCTDPTAFNYDATANTDDGSCVPVINGCTDPTAFNYDATANTDDGSCVPVINGCTDATAFNYNPAANTDDGSCVPVINGCTDPTAFNYDATANTDDGSCVPVINGCTDPTAFNYDAAANTDDGSCVPVINGCTDATAFNYNPAANTDDGSCVPVINGCTDPTAFNYDATANTDDGSCVPVINGCTDPTAFNYDATANTDDGSCVPVINGCTDATAFNYNPAANTDDGSCVPVINGCTDPTAFNYDATANTDDGSCVPVINGCTDPTAFNYDAAANTDDGSCVPVIAGCIDPLACNYLLEANTDDGTCLYGITESCNGVDDDCDGFIDNGFDLDGDLFTSCSGDCDDNNAFVFEGAQEICDDVDNDCNGETDENLVYSTYYFDGDLDGYGDLSISITDCVIPAGYVQDNTDCEDADSSINPGVDEICDDVDQDCDGNVNNGLPQQLYFEDLDGDGYGNPNISVQNCAPLLGYVLSDLDCDDLNDLVNPSVDEVCDDIDNDCDGNVDEDVLSTYYFDEDSDGYGDLNDELTACTIPVGYSLIAGDCSPLDATVNPGSLEICNGIDDNCDTEVDEGLTFSDYYIDGDNDGYGSDLDIVNDCELPQGYAPNDLDCDDTSSGINPGAEEVCDNVVDENCNPADDICSIVGCTDPTAFNYNPLANTDDGSCVPVINGCTDATAFNYNPAANTDDGSCVPVINGCTDPTAFNYDATANTDDGSCVPVINGCTDPTAFNYDATANTDDGSCVPVINGCTDATAFNYNPAANTDDGSCVPVINGCTDATAFNYNPAANTEDGSCVPVINGCTDATAFNYNPAANTDDGSCVPVINGCTDATAFNYNPAANTDDGSCVPVINGCTDATAFNYNPTANTDDGSCVPVVNGCTDPTAFNYDATANTDDGSCVPVINGCTDPTAFNYDATANTDDGSCVPVINGCTDATAFNYNPAANTDDGSCVPVINGCTDPTAFNYDATANTDDGSCVPVINGCTDPTAFNYDATANTDDGSCVPVINGCTDPTAFNYDATANTDDGSCVPVINGCTDPTAFNYDATANTDDGSCVPVINGCTDPTAFNYDATANTDDGSCVPVINGCTDATAFNFNPAANTDDGSCVPVINGCTDPTAFNYDATANTDDGSCVPVINGCTDPTAFNYDPTANVDDGSCVEVLLGCTDITACNYNELANVDDGTCLLPFVEDCNGLDDDCDGVVDNGFDLDQDGVTSCDGDCNDENPLINSLMMEVCDGLDNDCNEVVDDGFDQDFDGFTTCSLPLADCDDFNDQVFPGQMEICDGLDNDCNTLIDDGIGISPTVSISANQTLICDITTVIFVADTSGGGMNPTMQWLVNGVGVGLADVTFATNALVNGDVVTFEFTSSDLCAASPNPAVSNAISITVGIPTDFYEDLDGDGFGNIEVVTNDCSQPIGYVLDSTDCDDIDFNLNPGAAEICDNGVDENCDGVDEVCAILGCTDPTAFNYDAAANTDDGSCVPVINGCTDPTAFNYDATANTDDGSCVPVINGCTDPTAFNYNPTANTDDGSCVPVINGCTDATAFNYNPAANTDDGSCVPVINGCTDPTAFNYDATANTDDGSCVPVINGCTDATAFNYNPAANTDDGSCVPVINGCTDPTAFNYDATANTDDGSCVPVINGCTDPTAFNYNPAANTDDGSCVPVINGCTDATAFNYNPAANTDDGSCVPVINGCTDATAFNYNPASNTDDGSCVPVINGCTDPTALNYDATANTDDGSCVPVINGCTDPTAFNYDATANTDDGSCVPVINGCTDATAFNYNPAANTDDGSCVPVINGCTDPTAFNYDATANTDDGSCVPVINGCTDATAFNYNPAANTDDGSCVPVINGCTDPTAFNYDATANTDDGSCVPVINGCTDPTAFNYNATANTDDGSCVPVINGCTDPTAFNYDATANTDDGSCVPVINGCTDPTAFNYDATANTDDGSCVPVINGCTDPTAFNYDATANTDDGSCVPVINGCTDPTAFNYDATANTDDGSCVPVINGCTDATAFNYNPAANTDDGSCVPVINGCTDPTAFNYDATANTDDGSCVPVINGCTDPTAFNYDAAANTDDGSCVPVINGCTDPTAFNYDATANTDDGSCQYGVLGCLDATACNYNAEATLDDGSCIYPLVSYVDCDGNCLNDNDVDGVCDEDDCDDDNAGINQNVIESCNGLDDNCDGTTDEGFDIFTYYIDSDFDGYGGVLYSTTCSVFGEGYSLLPGDCDDVNPLVSPLSEEVCNTIDDNCDGLIDEGFIELLSFLDADMDGMGNDNNSYLGCEIPDGYVLLLGDCDDTNPGIYMNAAELCNGVDDDCDGFIDDGLSTESLPATVVGSSVYPTCTTGNLFPADMNQGADSPMTIGGGLDLWYRLTAETNALRVSLSAATGENAIELYRDYGTCMELIEIESEIGVSNQILYNDELTAGGEYLIACRALNGASNPFAKICFSHFETSLCDHSLVNNTGVYNNVCNSFKVQYRGNALNYTVNVQSAEQNGLDLGINEWSYTTPTASQVIQRLGYFLPVNLSGAPIEYTVSVDVNYGLADAAGNMEYFTARKGENCSIVLNAESSVVLRTSDRCPTLKSLNSTISTNRQVCGAIRYDWMFIQFQPSVEEPIIVEGPNNVNTLNVGSIPGIGNSHLYKVLVRPVFDNGLLGEWGEGFCMKTTASGMVMEPGITPALAQLTNQGVNYSVYPNPGMGNSFTIQSNQSMEGIIEVRMMDVVGNLIQLKAIQSENSNVMVIESTDQWANGVYLIKINFNGQEEVIRWVKQ